MVRQASARLMRSSGVRITEQADEMKQRKNKRPGHDESSEQRRLEYSKNLLGTDDSSSKTLAQSTDMQF